MMHPELPERLDDQLKQPRSSPGRHLRIFTFVCIAVSLLLIAEITARVVVAPRTGDANATKDVQVERQVSFVRDVGSAKIVIAGTSMAGVGIDPAVLTHITGRSTFNAALGCANPHIVADWLPNFVAPELSPDIVVLAIPPSDLDSRSCPRSWTDIEMLTVSAGDKRSLQQRLNPRPFLWEHSALWRQRPWLREINNLPYLVVDVPWTWDVTFRPDGFWQVDAWAETNQETFILEPHRTQITIDRSRVSAIQQTIADLTSQGVEVVIAELPMANRWIDHLSGSLVSHAEAKAALQEIASEAGLKFLRAPVKFHENNRFVDEGHMTPTGSQQYSQWLGTQLTTL